MFIVVLTYKQPLEVIDRFLEEHREFLDKHIQGGKILLSGRKVPRNGGIIMVRGDDLRAVQHLMQQDPFYLHNIAEYEFIQFEPMKWNDQIFIL